MPDKKITLLYDLVAETKRLVETIQDHDARYGRFCRGDKVGRDPCPIATPENLVKMCTDLGLHMYFFEAALVHEQHHFPDNTNN